MCQGAGRRARLGHTERWQLTDVLPTAPHTVDPCLHPDPCAAHPPAGDVRGRRAGGVCQLYQRGTSLCQLHRPHQHAVPAVRGCAQQAVSYATSGRASREPLTLDSAGWCACLFAKLSCRPHPSCPPGLQRGLTCQSASPSLPGVARRRWNHCSLRSAPEVSLGWRQTGLDVQQAGQRALAGCHTCMIHPPPTPSPSSDFTVPPLKPIFPSINMTDACYSDPTTESCTAFRRTHMGALQRGRLAAGRG